jgi:hypothetical protein
MDTTEITRQHFQIWNPDLLGRVAFDSARLNHGHGQVNKYEYSSIVCRVDTPLPWHLGVEILFCQSNVEVGVV